MTQTCSCIEQDRVDLLHSTRMGAGEIAIITSMIVHLMTTSLAGKRHTLASRISKSTAHSSGNKIAEAEIEQITERCCVVLGVESLH